MIGADVRFGSKADILSGHRDVCLVPIADIILAFVQLASIRLWLRVNEVHVLASSAESNLSR